MDIDEIKWSVNLIGKEFESDIWNYGFYCENTIKECVSCSFNCSMISEHIIKVLMPVETVKYEKKYGIYDSYNSKKIIIIEEVYYE